MRSIRILNVTLIIVSALLFTNLFLPLDKITGNIIYNLDNSEPKCYFINQGIENEISIDSCCYEIQKEIWCKSTNSEIKCYSSEDAERYYLVSNKLLSYCELEGYDVKVE